MNTNTEISGQRDYLFDNIRAFLILLVVIGHMIAEQKRDIMVAELVYYFIYLFHMPAFIFITGYFSKNLEKSRENAVKSFLIPYLILNILFVALGKLTLYDTNSSFRLFNPVWGLWFLLAVFIWKMLLKDLIHIKYILPLSFIVGILSGFSEEFTEKMSLSRVVNFLPFFLIGYYCKKEHIDKIRRFPKWIAIVVLSIYGLVSYVLSTYSIIKMETIYMRKPYSKIAQSSLTSAFGRIFIYISAIIIILCLINLFSSTSTWYTKIGQNSLTVYVLHLVAVSNIRNIELAWDRTPYFLLYSIIVSFILSYLFSRDIVIRVYKSIMDFITKLVYR